MRFSRGIDMTEGPIVRQLVSFAAPMIIGLVFQQLYNTVDTFVVVLSSQISANEFAVSCVPTRCLSTHKFPLLVHVRETGRGNAYFAEETIQSMLLCPQEQRSIRLTRLSGIDAVVATVHINDGFVSTAIGILARHLKRPGALSG